MDVEEGRIQGWDRWLWAGAAAVVLWRAVAIYHPHGADSDPQPVRLALAPLGLLFTACGLWAFRQVRSRASLLFAAYGITAGLHWGGPMGFGLPRIDAFLLATYVVVSAVLGQALFLHLALAFPVATTALSRRSTMAVLYLPSLVGALLLLVVTLWPAATGNPAVAGAFGLLLGIGVLYGLFAGGVWIRRLVVASPAERRRLRLGLVVTALVVGFLPHALTSAGLTLWPGYDGFFNLTFAFVPVALALALARPRG